MAITRRTVHGSSRINKNKYEFILNGRRKKPRVKQIGPMK
jgi:hypothetical protein